MKRFLISFEYFNGCNHDDHSHDEVLIAASNKDAAIERFFARYAKYFWINNFSTKELTQTEYTQYCKKHSYEKYRDIPQNFDFLKNHV